MATSDTARNLFAYAASEHPNLKLLVTDAQRDRAVDQLQAAFADGRLTVDEFDERMGRALQARTRKDLNACFDGLVMNPVHSQALAAHPAYNPVINQHRDGVAGRAVAGAAHLTQIPFPLIGPGVIYALTEKGSFARRHAAKAFNFQVLMFGLLMVAGILDFEILAAMAGIGWFVGVIVGAVKGFSGEEFRNVATAVMPWRPLDEGHGTRPRALTR